MKTNEENSYTRRFPRVDGICVSLVSSDNSEFAASSESYQYARSFEPAPVVSSLAGTEAEYESEILR